MVTLLDKIARRFRKSYGFQCTESRPSYFITIDDIQVKVMRKNVKNLRLVVASSSGKVSVTVPLNLSDEELEFTLSSKLEWIRKKQSFFSNKISSPSLQIVSDELHFYHGNQYRLEVLQSRTKNSVQVKDEGVISLTFKNNTDVDKRVSILTEWYRKQIKEIIPDLIRKWQPIVGVEVDDWGVKKMRTRWGTCNIQARRIWLNLELIKWPVECLEFVIVHEMVHLLERYHNANFRSHMDRVMPQWRIQEERLNKTLLDLV